MDTAFLKELKKGLLIGFGFISAITLTGIALATYSTLSTVNSWTVLSTGLWNEIRNNLNDHESRLALTEEKTESSATLLAHLTNWGTIISANGWYAQFSAAQNSDENVFEIVSTGNYGIRFKKAGRISWAYQQDFRTAGGWNYVQLSALIDGIAVVHALASPTNNLWDGINNHGVYNVSAWQVLTFSFAGNTCVLNGLDNGTWWRIGIFWMGKK